MQFFAVFVFPEHVATQFASDSSSRSFDRIIKDP
jgi:hypothetical protein